MPFVKRERKAADPNRVEQGLLGKWFGTVGGQPTAVEFRPDGRMAYVVTSGGKQQTMLLTWRIDGEDLDHRSAIGAARGANSLPPRR